MQGGEPVVFEPSLVPVTPNDQSVGAVYYTPASFQWTTQSNITAVVDTPYNVIDVRKYYFTAEEKHVCEISGCSILRFLG